MDINISGATGLSKSVVQAHLDILQPYTQELRKAKDDTSYAPIEASLHTPFDTETIARAKELGARFHEKTKTVLLVGIGGSDLGTRAIYDALYGHLDRYVRVRTPRLLSFATVEPRVLSSVREVFKEHEKPEEIVLIVVSKSGSTTETIANANTLFSLFSEQFGKDAAVKQTVIISDADTPLAQKAQEANMEHVAIPHMVGGRYSVFTAVGLVPLAILGMDIDAFTEGAQSGINASLQENMHSSAAILAAFLFEAYLNNMYVHELFMFNPELETLGKWYRQLLAESLGKESAGGATVGITPTVAIGSTDLHSVAQLIFGGRNDRFTTFVSVPEVWKGTPKYVSDSPFSLSMLEGKETGDAMQAIYTGVQSTYKKHKLPHVSFELDALNERELGAFMAVHMTSIMYLAKLFDVNAFDQPAVETYKSEVRRLLENES